MDCLGIMAREVNQLGKVNQARPPGRPRGGEAMRVLVACEESQEVCKAFRAGGRNNDTSW